jgi:cytochrome P450
MDLLDGALFARGDADRVFAALRRTAPVAWHATPQGGGFWSVLRHADVVTVLRDPATFSSARGTGHVSAHDARDAAPSHRSLNASDGDVHRALRAIVADAFGPDAVAAHAPWQRARAAALVDGLVARGGGDAVGELAEVLALDWLARVLGIAGDDRARLADATQAIARHADPRWRPAGLAAMTAGEAFLAGERALFALIFAWVDDRRAHRRDDVLGRLVACGAALDERDLVHAIRLLALTGHHSTALAIAGAVHALAGHPDQAARFAAGAPISAAIDEVLRWTSPIVRFGRFAARDAVIAGQPIARGDRVVVWFRSANRDAAVFVDPDRFDIARAPNPHVAFGAGPHACFGEPFVRVQLAAALEAVRGVRFALAGEPAWLASSVTSGLVALPIAASPRAR